MDETLVTNPKEPTWKVHARPFDAPHEPWQTLLVSARSPIQAQAILNRKGYEMAIQTAIQVNEEPDTIDPAQLEAIKCVMCGYKLAGLQLASSSVTCPECAYQQPLLVWRRDQSTGVDKNHPIMGILAIIGAIVVMLISIPIIFMLIGAILNVFS